MENELIQALKKENKELSDKYETAQACYETEQELTTALNEQIEALRKENKEKTEKLDRILSQIDVGDCL